MIAMLRLGLSLAISKVSYLYKVVSQIFCSTVPGCGYIRYESSLNFFKNFGLILDIFSPESINISTRQGYLHEKFFTFMDLLERLKFTIAFASKSNFPSLTKRTIWGHRVPYGTILYHTDHTEPYRTKQDNMGPFGTIQDHMDHKGPYRTIQDHRGPQPVI